ncbi:MAG: signal peptidase I [Anaerolineae bacterium]|nr:signal peptidase I [Anaerolineae bacterium]
MGKAEPVAEIQDVPLMPEQPDAHPRLTEESEENSLRELLETLVLTLILFALIRSVIQNFRIEGVSMEPNFHDGQFLIINKLAYKLGTPARGDVIVFRYPRDPHRDFIKRVIGLPGDTVRVDRGRVYINGVPVYEPYALLSGGSSGRTTTVTPGHVYVLGDNRRNSSDSRRWGLVPMKMVIGKAWICYWPPKDWSIVPHYKISVDP